MTTADPALLDELLPHYDVSARHSVRVNAPAELVYRVVQRGVPLGALARVLIKLRDIPRLLKHGKQVQRTPDNAFYKLKQLENREVVIGIIGQFWKAAPEPVTIRSLDDFLLFQTEGFCKAAMNFRIQETGTGGCMVTTETRVIAYGGRAKARFEEYWGLIGPFSGLIRKEMLKKIKREAELKGRKR